jgi:hypothetical protein
VLEEIRVPRIKPGRPRAKPDSLAADKAYSNGPCRQYLRRRGLRHIIPEKTDSQATRLRKRSRDGRPPGFDEERYKKRNTVERAINKLKQSRPSPPVMTSAATSSSAPQPQRPWSSGSALDRPDRSWTVRTRHRVSEGSATRSSTPPPLRRPRRPRRSPWPTWPCPG